jgi:hypothetical protein
MLPNEVGARSSPLQTPLSLCRRDLRERLTTLLIMMEMNLIKMSHLPRSAQQEQLPRVTSDGRLEKANLVP